MDKELLAAVYKMREAQNTYWGVKTTYHFTEMRRAENVVDRILENKTIKDAMYHTNEPIGEDHVC